MPENLNKLYETVGRMESKIDLMLEFREEQSEALGKHDARLGSLERWRSLLLGAWTVLAGFLGLIFGGSR